MSQNDERVERARGRRLERLRDTAICLIAKEILGRRRANREERELATALLASLHGPGLF
ncbi:MAG: hypothetical protein H6739_30280 [Alphaproteobacteria bacterium]|nr:hypothetical protein [Alphaproteobacteria bacterium]